MLEMVTEMYHVVRKVVLSEARLMYAERNFLKSVSFLPTVPVT